MFVACMGSMISPGFIYQPFPRRPTGFVVGPHVSNLFQGYTPKNIRKINMLHLKMARMFFLEIPNLGGYVKVQVAFGLRPPNLCWPCK